MGGEQDDVLINKLSSLVSQFESAEGAIKSAELAEGDLALTPVNQLRYGFKHLTQAIKAYRAGNFADFDNNIGQALGHCKRSYYDARDVEIVFHLNRFQEFSRSAQEKGIILSNILPEYPRWVSIAAETKHFLETAPAIIENKDERYEEITVFLGKMKIISNHLPGALEVVNENLAVQRKLQEEAQRLRKEADENREATKNSLSVSKRSFYAAILAILVAVGLVVFDEPVKAFGKKIVVPKSP